MTGVVESNAGRAPEGVVLILGMHRSGTSAVVAACQVLGLDPGADLLTAMDGVNELGFWELRPLVELDEKLLAQIASCWFDVRPLDRARLRRLATGDDGARAADLIRSLQPTRSIAALKDPRMCRLLPFWLPVLRDVVGGLSVVLVVRQPQEVVGSLLARDGFDELSAILLWLSHTLESERDCRGMPVTVLPYDSLLDDPVGVARQMGLDLGLHWPVAPERCAEQLKSALPGRLRHQRVRDAHPRGMAARLAERVYALLSSGGADNRVADLDACWQEYLELLDRAGDFLESLHRTNLRMVAARQEASRLGSLHEHALGVIDQRDEQMRSLGKAHRDALDVVEQRDTEMTKLGQEHRHALDTVEERDCQLAVRNAEFSEIESALQEVRGHWLWWLMAPLLRWRRWRGRR